MKVFATALRYGFAGAAFLVLSSAASAQFQRIVLLEEYTSVTCGPCARAGQNLNAIMAAYPGRTVSVRYHTNFIPNPKDRFYEANKTENDARKTYYGWVGMPVIRVDGTTEPPATNKTEVESRVTAQMDVESPIRIDVTHQLIEGNQASVTVTVTAGADGVGSGNRLRVVALEALVHDPLFANSPYNGEVEVPDIMRKFLGTTDGEAIEMSANEIRSFTYTYAIDPSWQSGQMYAVAFVQDDFDKAVMQAGFSPRPVSSADEPELAGYSAHAAAPNPTTGVARVDYSLGRPGPLDVSIIDAAGTLVSTLEPIETSATSGAVSVDLGALGLPAGVYTIALSSGDWRWSDRIVVVR